MFKLTTWGESEKDRISLFRIMCGVKVMEWSCGREFVLWKVLKEEFKKTRCKRLSSTEAMQGILELCQGEDKRVQEYTLKFEEFERFLGDAVLEQRCFGFLCKTLRKGSESIC